MTRLSGENRYATAVSVSQRFAPGVEAVFVATGTNFPDALSAAAAAAANGSPLLLTAPGELPVAVRAEIERLRPATIYVVGGTGAVTTRVERTLRGLAHTERLDGDDRYATGRGIVGTFFSAAETVFLATGASFPDALAATGAAGALAAPVLLVPGTTNTIDSATRSLLSSLGTRRVILVGGPAVISDGIQRNLADLGYSVSRQGGRDRYETAAAVNGAAFVAGDIRTTFLATGADFPDALAGAALAGYLHAPLFVTSAGCTPEVIHTALDASGATSRVVLGGTAVVSDTAAENLGCMTSSVPTITGNPAVSSSLSVAEGTWTPGVGFGYTWFANGVRIRGAATSSLSITNSLAGKSITVQVTGSKPGYVSASATSRSVVIGYPSRTTPVDSWTCPSWAPIKGNANSMIYHVPGGSFYDRTNPEECFATESAAVAAGYRKSKV